MFLAEITKIEFYSASWKKVTTQEITVSEAVTLIKDFENDMPNYHFVKPDNPIQEQAKLLIYKHGKQGLRTL